MSLDPRFDYQISPSNTLSMHYAYCAMPTLTRPRTIQSAVACYNTLGTNILSREAIPRLSAHSLKTKFATASNATRIAVTRSARSNAKRRGYFNGAGNSQGTAALPRTIRISNYSSINHKNTRSIGVRCARNENSTALPASTNFHLQLSRGYVAGNPYQFTQTATAGVLRIRAFRFRRRTTCRTTGR